MFIFGHLGIGSKLAGPFSKKLPRKALLLGTLLPDLIDKPLFYGRQIFYNTFHFFWGTISNTRTFGHTGLLTLAFSGLAYKYKSRVFTAITLGMITHLFIDNVGDYFDSKLTTEGLITLLWPLFGLQFPPSPYMALSNHIKDLLNSWNLYGECIGFGILTWDYHKTHHNKAPLP